MKKERKTPSRTRTVDFSRGVRGYYNSRIPAGSGLRRLTAAEAKAWLLDRLDREREAARLMAEIGRVGASLRSRVTELRNAAEEQSVPKLKTAIRRLERDAARFEQLKSLH